MEEVQESKKTEHEVETQDESVQKSIGEKEEPQKQEDFGENKEDVDIFGKTQEEIITETEKESLDVQILDEEGELQDLEAVEVSVVEREEIQMEEFEEPKAEDGHFDKSQEEQHKDLPNETQKFEDVELKRENSGKPSRPRFTVAAAWQRSLSIGEKDENTPPTAPETGSAKSKVPSESGPDPETKEVQESEPEPKGVQESKPEPKEVQESRAEIQQVQESMIKPETEVQESRPEPGPETSKESPAAVPGLTQNPFGVRLRRTQALQRFIAEDEQKQDVRTNKVEPLSSTKPVQSPKSPPPTQPITVKTPPPNPPVTAKPSVLNLPIMNKTAPTNPPISAKPVLPRKPEAEGGNKLKRTSDAASEPPSWISVAKHKQKVYKENSSVTHKDEAEKKTQESSKVISLNLKPASPLSPPTPVPPMAPKPSHSCPTPAQTKPLSPPPPPATSARPTAQNLSHPCPCPAPASPPSSPPPRVTSPQDEPPWMALAKKKAKAWSEMPQIVQ